MKLNSITLLASFKRISVVIELNEAVIDLHPNATCTLVNPGLTARAAGIVLFQVVAHSLLRIMQLNVIAHLTTPQELSILIELNKAVDYEGQGTVLVASSTPPANTEEPLRPSPMDTAADFNAALQAHGLPPAYRYDAAVHRAQQALPGSLPVLEAFRRGLPALFETCRIDPNRDGFAAMVASQPGSFGLTAGATAEQVRAAILRGLAADPALAFDLLPAGDEPQAADGTPLFPPEEGEPVADHWIWTVHCPGFFPGPAWLLVPRNGEDPPFAYGYL